MFLFIQKYNICTFTCIYSFYYIYFFVLCICIMHVYTTRSTQKKWNCKFYSFSCDCKKPILLLKTYNIDALCNKFYILHEFVSIITHS